MTLQARTKEKILLGEKELGCGTSGCVYPIQNKGWTDYVLKLENDKINSKWTPDAIQKSIKNEQEQNNNVLTILSETNLTEHVLIVNDEKFREKISCNIASVLMKTCDGNDLQTVLKQNANPQFQKTFIDIKTLVTVVCQMLFLFHSKQLFHNDIKLENIMLCTENLYLIDFGLLSIKDTGGSPIYWYYPSYIKYLTNKYQNKSKKEKVIKTKEEEVINKLKATFEENKIDLFYQQYKTFFQEINPPPTFLEYAISHNGKKNGKYTMAKKDLYAFGVTLLYILYNFKKYINTDKDNTAYDQLQLIIGAFIFEEDLNGIISLRELYHDISYQDITFDSLYEKLKNRLNPRKDKNEGVFTKFTQFFNLCKNDICPNIPIIQKWPTIRYEEKEGQVAGSKNKLVYVLGRKRKIYTKIKREYVIYNKKLITLAKARKIEAIKNTKI